MNFSMQFKRFYSYFIPLLLFISIFVQCVGEKKTTKAEATSCPRFLKYRACDSMLIGGPHIEYVGILAVVRLQHRPQA